MSQIVVRNLNKRFGGAVALDDVSLKIESGELLVLLGPSGCGKTTLLRCLAGLERPDQGEITIGEDVVFSSIAGINRPPGKRKLGMVFQSYALWPHMTVHGNIKFGLDVLKLPQSEVHARIESVLFDLGMTNLVERYPSELSGGQQQRVALARLLATKPSVFLMDEPLSNLDARLRTDMRVELKRLQQSLGATTVYVTHDQTEAMTMSTRVVVMKEGQIEQIAKPRDLYRAPETTFVADFIGMPRINLIPLSRLLQGSASYANEDVAIGLESNLVAEEIIVGARPEDILVSQCPTGDGETFVVDSVLPNGPEIILQLRRGSTPLIARVSHDCVIEEGRQVNVNFNIAALNVYDAVTGRLLDERCDSMLKRSGQRMSNRPT